MSGDLFIVKTETPMVMAVSEFKAEIVRIAKFLLNQPESFHLDLEILGLLKDGAPNSPPDFNYYAAASRLEKMDPFKNDDFYFLVNTSYSGICQWFFFCPIKYGPEDVRGHGCEFWTEIRGKPDELFWVIGIAALIAAANLLSAKTIYDNTGHLARSGDSDVPIDAFLRLAVRESLPLGQALSKFYWNIHGKHGDSGKGPDSAVSDQWTTSSHAKYLEDNWASKHEFLVHGLVWQSVPMGKDQGIYGTEVDGRSWRIRLNNFPDEPAYTLLVDGTEIIHFNDWPKEWVRPSIA